LAKGRAPAGIIRLKNLRGAQLVIILGVGGAAQKKIQAEKKAQPQEGGDPN
jgi:hypothetical protein